jgi:hypothetical protein
MIRLSAAIVALSSIVSLSACGAVGGSEFATKATAACVKDQGEASAAKCACQARIIEQALNDKEKKFLLVSMNAADLGPEAGMKALTDSGLTLADMASMGSKMQGLDTRSEAECNK